jgi:hypothetical protein
MTTSRRFTRLHAAVAAWLLIVAAGLALVSGGRRGVLPVLPDAAAAQSLQAAASGAPQAAQPRLLMFMHPQCPCTRASLRELERALARRPAPVDLYVYLPAEEPESWAHTATWKLAAAIPGVTLHIDRDAALARRFAARVSGEVIVQSAEGAVLYAGGITSAAGHEGANPGRDAIEAHLAGRPAPDRQPVYGCEIF